MYKRAALSILSQIENNKRLYDRVLDKWCIQLFLVSLFGNRFDDYKKLIKNNL